MRERTIIENKWDIWKLEPDDVQRGILVPALHYGKDGVSSYVCDEAKSVHEILFLNDALEERVLVGDCSSCEWVAESDWLYRVKFAYKADVKKRTRLVCEHVDTLADFYLNGTLIGSHDDSYIPFLADVTKCLEANNVLTIHFKSPLRAARELGEKMPEAWKEHLRETTLIRKPQSVFGDFLGAHPYLVTIGLAAPVYLDQYETGCLKDINVVTKVSKWLDTGFVSVLPEVEGETAQLTYQVTVTSPDGNILDQSGRISYTSGSSYDLTIAQPDLWWPHTHGDQPLYLVECRLYKDEILLDVQTKKVGLRRIECNENFDIKVNNRSVRIWGANMVNLQALTQGWDHKRGEDVLKWAIDSHMNILRVWGEAPQMSDEFYDYCDTHGILVWQDFYIGYGFWPDTDDYLEKYRLEAEYMVRRLRHHSSLMMWCGSNESYMYALSVSGDHQTYGFDIVFKVVRDVCRELDPDRWYYASSPMGGEYPQSPLAGDMHGYNRINFEPGSDYPVLFSEFCHMTPLSRHSTLRMMSRDEIFPEGYINQQVYTADFDEIQAVDSKYAMVSSNYWRKLPVPETWKAHLSVFSPAEIDDIQNYYDATDADSLLYRYGINALESYKAGIERARRGRPSYQAQEPRISRGLIVWKFNDIIPHMDFTLVDAYCEPSVTYYAVKRAFQPLLVSLHVEGTHLYLWAINDSGEDFCGTIVFRVFERINNRIGREIKFPVSVRPCESILVSCLDFIGPIRLDCLLHAQMYDMNGTLCSSNIAQLDKECNLPFPDAHLTLARDGEDLLIKTDAYARYIELTGDDDGDEFGWYFEDNYFDLLPFEEKRIRIGGKHRSGIIHAKAHYSSEETVIAWDRKDER